MGLKAYYSGLFGALGGLVGYIIGLIVTSVLNGVLASSNPQVVTLLQSAIIGACAGAGIGFMLSISVSSGPLGAAVFSAFTSLIGGAVIGAVSGTLADVLLRALAIGFPELIRSGVWALYGLAIGFIVGARSNSQGWILAMGGLIGGLVGGFIQVLLQRFATDQTSNSLFVALGLVVTGFAVGVLMQTADSLLRTAWLERPKQLMLDKKKGFFASDAPDAFTLDKALMTGEELIVGSDIKVLKSQNLSGLYLDVPNVEGRHAGLKSTNKRYFEVSNYSRSGDTYVNGARVGTGQMLRNGDILRFGTIEYVYHARAEEQTTQQIESGGTTAQPSGGRVKIKNPGDNPAPKPPVQTR